MLGMPIIGHFIAHKSGHRLNNLLLKELMSKKDCWEIVTCTNEKKPISFILLEFLPLELLTQFLFNPK